MMLRPLTLTVCDAPTQCYICKGKRACRIKTLAAIVRYGVCCQGKGCRAPGSSYLLQDLLGNP